MSLPIAFICSTVRDLFIRPGAAHTQRHLRVTTCVYSTSLKVSHVTTE